MRAADFLKNMERVCVRTSRRSDCALFWRSHLAGILVLLSLVMLSGAARSQTSRPRLADFAFTQFRLVPIQPASRPASLGGAFIAIADDATAAAINPAGISFLSTPEISLSHSAGWHTTDFAVSRQEESNGRARQYQRIFDQTLVNITYPQWGFTFAAFRQVAFRSEFSFSRRQFLTLAPNRPLTLAEQLGAGGNFPGLASEHYCEVIHNAVVVARTLPGGVHLGLSLRATQLRLQLDERQYFEPALWQQTDFTGMPEQSVPVRIEGLYRIDHAQRSQFKPGYSLGMLFEFSPRWTLGAVYEHLPAYEIVNRITLPAYTLPDRAPDDGRDDSLHFTAEEKRVPFTLNLPDFLGFGLSWRAHVRLLLAADVLLYRSRGLLQGLHDDLPQDDVADRDPDGLGDVAAHDHVSWRAGVEYRLIELGRIWPLRLGIYSEPNFGWQAVSRAPAVQREFPDKSGFLHFTSGAGVVLNNKVRFETSLDVSPERGQISLIGSAVLRL
ncbi:MAG: hypothetical protein DKINENOH_02346 [bacterium]|nr:hypothetical protein [bacterium]